MALQCLKVLGGLTYPHNSQLIFNFLKNNQKVILIDFTAGIFKLIKGQPLTGQLEKSRKVQIQRAESFAGDR